MNQLLMTGITDIGRVRQENEDCIALEPEVGLVVLADGMGGHQAGEVASRMAVDVITRHVVEAFTDAKDGGDDSFATKTVLEAIQIANGAIHELASTKTECAGMGSTVVVTLFYGNKMCVAHVGDSRLYRFRDGALEQLTQDHSVIQELVSRGLMTMEEARKSIGKNLVTRALGVDATVKPDISEQPFQNEDIYLLCSDGLNDVVPDGDIEMMLMEYGRNLDAAAQRMVDTANDRGGPDNVSVILVCASGLFVRNKEALHKLQQLKNQV
jgi:serine/threonine protein phosphatase PrpC